MKRQLSDLARRAGAWLPLVRVVIGPEGRLVVRYLRPKLPTLGLIGVMGLVSTAVEVLRLLVLFSTLLLIVGQVGEGTEASLFGVPLELPFISDLEGLSGLVTMIAALAVLTAAKEGIDFLAQALSYRVQARLMLELRRDIFEKTLSLELGYFSGTRVGDIGYLQTSIIDRFQAFVPTARQVIQHGLDLGVAMLILAVISVPLTALALLVGITHFALNGRLRKRVRGLQWQFESANRAASSHFLELVHGIRLVKLGGQKDHVRTGYLGRVGDAMATFVRAGTYEALARGVAKSGVVVIVLILAMAMDALAGLTTGEVLGFLAIAYRASQVLQNLVESQLRLNAMVPSMLIACQYLLDDTAVERSRRVALPPIAPIRHSVAADRISFAFEDHEVLTDVDLSFDLGTTTAIVGSSGSGKTTLLEIMAGYRDAERGRLVVDGNDVSGFDIDSYRAQVGYVTQDPTIFHETIRSNVAFLRPNADQDEIDRAVRLAAAADFIGSNGRGLESIVGERGLKVSGGQRQRIALARVIVQDPRLLLLDEATNALDLYTEARVFENLVEVARDKIVIVVAHRLSAISHFDRIIVIHDGQVVEQGSHEELMAAGGRYFHLYELQGESPEASLAALEAH
jgi:ATP-binding cassette, subfamily B, putative efflux pump